MDAYCPTADLYLSSAHKIYFFIISDEMSLTVFIMFVKVAVKRDRILWLCLLLPTFNCSLVCTCFIELLVVAI